MFEGMDFENTPLVVESLSKEMQNPPRVLQEKKPGGGEAAQNSSWRAHTCLPPMTTGPKCLPHCSITTGCSHKGALTRLIGLKLTNSKRHIPAGRTQLSGGAYKLGDPCL